MQLPPARGGSDLGFSDGMPLKFRQTGLAFPPGETRKDCTAFSGGWAVGHIYYEAREGDGDGDEPRTWFWSIHGVFGKPIGMRGHGVAATLEGAQADLEEQWQKWLRWAHLEESEPEG